MKHLENLPVFSVSELSQTLRKTLEGAFSYVKVRGEISGFKKAPSGHMYFNIKDSDNVAVLAAICWRGNSAAFTFAPEDGLEVFATGKVTTYSGQSKYQLIVERVEHAGAGALMALLEKRKKMFVARGVFASHHKKPLPRFPRVIGVITSPTGAVIKDILHRIEERFPTHIVLWPVLVQGEKAAQQVSDAIAGFNRFTEHGAYRRPDVIIVARGGGSIEDLWPFNEENVVWSVFHSEIPVISAVGHETDTTLIDYVADLRAPTPTAAAELAVPVKLELLAALHEFHHRIKTAGVRLWDDKRKTLLAIWRSMSRPEAILMQKLQRLDYVSARWLQAFPQFLHSRKQNLMILGTAIRKPEQLMESYEVQLKNTSRALWLLYKNILTDKNNSLQLYHKLLTSYSYKDVLRRGFALLRDKQGHVVSFVRDLKPGMGLCVELQDGQKEIIVDGHAPSCPGAKPSSPFSGQGNLFDDSK